MKCCLDINVFIFKYDIKDRVNSYAYGIIFAKGIKEADEFIRNITLEKFEITLADCAMINESKNPYVDIEYSNQIELYIINESDDNLGVFISSSYNTIND